MTPKKIIGFLVALSFALPGYSQAETLTRSFSYVLKGKRGNINVNLDSGTYNYIYNIPRLACPTCSSITERDRPIITEATQKAALAPLIAAIQAEAKKVDDQARIAVSLAQNIPYDWDKSDEIEAGGNPHLRYPYEVLYDNKQICSENSYLIAFLLTELGYSAGVFLFPEESHDVAALRCPAKYSYKGTGYCFIESTSRRIITYNTMASRYTGDYILEDLTPTGREFSPKKDYQDAQKYKKYYDKWFQGKLGKKSNKKFNKIKKKYGLN
ncbi:MAG: hypothetical protein FJZ04_00645 [Candidatus Moranbacteria bacterium]|nr:hypothetical protein [Candidatus Moranbacteria bacterium]